MSLINIIKIVVDSKSELKERLKNSNLPNLLIGTDSEVENNFYILRGKIDNISTIFEIGIISEGNGLEPECKLIDEKYICIGLNKEVHIIDSHDFSNDHKIILDSLFYQFVLLEKEDKIIVVHELGVTCISLNGIKLWECLTDLINDYIIRDDTIELITDESIITILKSTGKIIYKG